MMKSEQIFKLGEKMPLRWEHGPVSFGLVLAGSVVSWSGETSKDLLISRCWDGIYLYPSSRLADEELNAEPIKVCDSIFCPTMGYPCDWNKDGVDDLLVADRWGFLYLMERRGDFPNISFEFVEVLRDKGTGLPINIPFENPNLGLTHDLGGYDDPYFSNYLYPAVYPSGENKGIDLVIGDWAGNLWWLRDLSDGKGKPEYTGVRYKKPEADIRTEYGKRCLQKYGNEYVRPERICDENGKSFLLGEGIECGTTYEGGNTKPVLCRNNVTGSNDLLVLAGVGLGGSTSRLHYLRRVNSPADRKPVFKNLGDVHVEGINTSAFGCHSKLIVNETDGWNDLMISGGPSFLSGCIAVLRNKRLDQVVPEFEFDRWISGKDAVAGCYNITEILKDSSGKRYALDNANQWHLREIKTADGKVRLSSESLMLRDQNGVFKVEGETDPQLGKDWGFHRAAKWDFDRGGKQHLIVGTDKGLLYLLIDDGDSREAGEFKFRSVGPLRDRSGKIIKVHNRVCAVGVDLNANGFEDLIVGGVTYQLGTETDPDPGGGIYYLIHRGLDEDGLPMLESPKPLEIDGAELGLPINTHVQIQAVDLDKDGERKVVVAVQEDGFKGRVFKPLKDRVGLEYTGKALPCLSIEERILDIDDDGELEYVFSGGEQGVGHYQKI